MSKKGMNKKLSYTAKHYSATKKNKLLIYSEAWMNIKKQNKNSKRSQTQKRVCVLYESIYMKTKVK